MRRIAISVARLSCVFAVLLGTLAATAQAAGNPSLPSVSSGARPGPNLLYADPTTVPQLENTGVWKAAPILVSGAEAYRGGEFLYQDFLYDDHGGAGTADPTDPFNPSANLFSPDHGTLTYPTNTARYGNNAADLVEFRVKPLSDATAFRVTMNTMLDPSVTAFTVALGDSPVKYPWPFLAGVTSPAQYFLTVHGNTGVLTNALTGLPVSPAPTVSVDTARRQIDVLIPHTAWDPGHSTVRMEMGTGLWDSTTNHYLLPGPVASASQPGGASADGEALFNLAFRTGEPVPKIYSPGTSNTIVEGGVQVKQDGTWWRERDQADALANGDVSQFSAEVDFGKLAAGANDESGVPQTGDIDRIYAAHFNLGQGVDYNATCLGGTSAQKVCTGRYLGQLQPYALYVPNKPVPSKGFGLVIAMHGLSANYNEFLGSHNASQMANRGSGSIFASPEGRGPDGSWQNYAEADVFDMWNDIAQHYHLNPALTDVTGYSMGGEGTYELGSRWPDLWARAFPIVGPPTPAGTFKNFRNIPVMAWYGQNDELVGPELSEEAFANALTAGIRYDHWLFTPAGHITEGNNDEYQPAADFFGDATVDINPRHVTYYYDPTTGNPVVGPTDHAYWLSGITLRNSGSAGTLDVRSLSSGYGDPPVEAPQIGYHVLYGGSHGPLPYQERTINWGAAPLKTPANTLVINATNVSAVTIAANRAGVTCSAKLVITSDGPLQVHFTGCHLPLTQPGCPAATGRLSRAAIGLARLGLTRPQVRRRFRQSSTRGKRYEEFFCLAPNGVRVGYASPKLLRSLPRARRARFRNRVVWVSTANRRYAAAGIRPGAKLRVAKRRLHLSRGIRVGLNEWFFGRAGAATVLVKVRHGIVEEIGIATASLTASRGAQRRFSRSFS
jgi:predicted esterase